MPTILVHTVHIRLHITDVLFSCYVLLGRIVDANSNCQRVGGSWDGYWLTESLLHDGDSFSRGVAY